MGKIIIALYVLATSLALVFLKLGSSSAAPFSMANNRLHINLTAYSSAGLILYGISFVLYTYLIAKYELGYIIPVATAFVYIAIFVSSYFVFHESFTALKVLGIALISAGLIILNLKN